MDPVTDALLEQHRPLLAAACALARRQLADQGLTPELMPTLDGFSFRQHPDPFTGQATLNGHWAPADSQRRAQLVVNADGLAAARVVICSAPIPVAPDAGLNRSVSGGRRRSDSRLKLHC